MATYIRDLIDLPERVYRGDFVLRLTEGVTGPEETLRDYVVTPQLATCFDQALAFIRSAIDSRSSKAAYLHGSFGSGKSHFMAVLHVLLQGEPRARAIPELARVVAAHNTWTEGKRFLLVPYHLIGARTLESAILGQYAEHVRRLHSEAPLSTSPSPRRRGGCSRSFRSRPSSPFIMGLTLPRCPYSISRSCAGPWRSHSPRVRSV